MPRHCTICDHPNRSEIDAALVGNTPLRDIARQWRVSKDALVRHKEDHVPAHLSKALQAEEITQADTLLERLTALSKETACIFIEARAAKDNLLALKAITRTEKQIELQVRLLAEIHENNTTVNVLVLPEWKRLRSCILGARSAFPDAKLAVINAIETVSHGNE